MEYVAHEANVNTFCSHPGGLRDKEISRFEVETAGRHEIWVILFGFCQALLNLTRKILNEKT